MSRRLRETVTIGGVPARKATKQSARAERRGDQEGRTRLVVHDIKTGEKVNLTVPGTFDLSDTPTAAVEAEELLDEKPIDWTPSDETVEVETIGTIPGGTKVRRKRRKKKPE